MYNRFFLLIIVLLTYSYIYPNFDVVEEDGKYILEQAVTEYGIEYFKNPKNRSKINELNIYGETYLQTMVRKQVPFFSSITGGELVCNEDEIVKTIEMMIRLGADIEGVDCINQNILYRVLFFPNLIEYLLGKGLDINHLDDNLNNLLHILLQNFNKHDFDQWFQTIEFLIDNNIDLNVKNKQGENSFLLAVKLYGKSWKNKEIDKRLLSLIDKIISKTDMDIINFKPIFKWSGSIDKVSKLFEILNWHEVNLDFESYLYLANRATSYLGKSKKHYSYKEELAHYAQKILNSDEIDSENKKGIYPALLSSTIFLSYERLKLVVDIFGEIDDKISIRVPDILPIEKEFFKRGIRDDYQKKLTELELIQKEHKDYNSYCKKKISYL